MESEVVSNGSPQVPRHGPSSPVWAILLAGGDGTRVRGKVIAGERIDRPKQFCRFGGDRSLLASTLDRALHFSTSSRVVPVVSRGHREWWKSELERVLPENILEQPANRGTAAAILHALLHILQRDHHPTLLVFPCDHGVAREIPLLVALSKAVQNVRLNRRDLVLLGVSPDHPETEYGWILPRRSSQDEAHVIQLFIEKPSDETAADLMKQGALWNTLMFAASGRGLLARYSQAMPLLVWSYLSGMRREGWCDLALDRIYGELPVLDFARDVLQTSPDGVHVVRVPSCGWTDLGNPARIEAWLSRKKPSPATGEGAAGLEDARNDRHSPLPS